MTTFRVEDDSGTSYSDLNSGALQGMVGSWDTVVGEGVLTENMVLRCVGSVSTIIAEVKALEQRLEKAVLYHSDPFTRTPYWLSAFATGENAKRSLIWGYNMVPVQDSIANQLLQAAGAKYALSIDHDPFWEATTPDTNSTASGKTAFGYVMTISPTIGTLPSRISSFKITPDVGIAGALAKVFVGIQPTYDGVSHFVARMNEANGTGINGFNLTTGAGATYFDDNYRSLGAAPAATLTPYFSMSLAQHSASYYNEYRGRFLVLARMAVGGTGTIGVQLQHGNQRTGVCANELSVSHEMVYISGGLDYYELGEVEFPSTHSKASSDYMGDDGITISAMTISGSPNNFYLDGIFLIPSQHLARLEGAGINEVGNDQRAGEFITLPNGDQYAVNYYSGEPRYALQSQFTDFYLPVENGALVIFCVPSSGTAITHTVSYRIQTVARYATHNG